MPSSIRERALLLLFLPILGALLVVAALGPLPERLGSGLVALSVAGVAWLAAWGLSLRVRGSGAFLVLLLAGAVALRGVGLATRPELSDDVYRYAWEGAVVLEGQSPYAFAPDAPELSELRARHPRLHGAVNHPEVSAAYPPLAQAVHAGVVLVAGTGAEDVGRAALGFRVFYAACDLGVLALLVLLLRRSGRSPAPAVAWGWSPLVVLEFSGGAHLDVLGILFLIAALLVLARSGTPRRGLAAGLLVLGALVKLLPGLLVPFALRGDRRALLEGLGALALFGLAWVPVLFLSGGAGGLGVGLGEYSLRWESTSLLFRFVEPAFERFLDRDGSWLDARRVARATVGAIWVVCAVLVWRRRPGFERGALALIGAFLVLTPTLHPWYLTWIVPLLALVPSPSFALLVALAPLLYAPVAGWHARGVWEEPPWLWPVVALPFLAALIVETARTQRR